MMVQQRMKSSHCGWLSRLLSMQAQSAEFSRLSTKRCHGCESSETQASLQQVPKFGIEREKYVENESVTYG